MSSVASALQEASGARSTKPSQQDKSNLVRVVHAESAPKLATLTHPHMLSVASADNDARGVMSTRSTQSVMSNAVRPRHVRSALTSVSLGHSRRYRSRNAVHAVSGDRSVTARQLKMLNVASAGREARGVTSPRLMQCDMSNDVRPRHVFSALTSVSEVHTDTSSSSNAVHAVSGDRSMTLQEDTLSDLTCGSANEATWYTWLGGQSLPSKLLSRGRRDNIALKWCGSLSPTPNQSMHSASRPASNSVQNRLDTARADHGTLARRNTSLSGNRGSLRASGATILPPPSRVHVSYRNHIRLLVMAAPYLQCQHATWKKQPACQKWSCCAHRHDRVVATAQASFAEESQQVATCIGTRHTLIATMDTADCCVLRIKL